jgi:hypothetical protein
MFVLACCLQAASLPPPDSFRLTVEEVVGDSAVRVVTLKVLARTNAQMMEILHEPATGGSSIGLAPALKGKGRETTIVLAAMYGDTDTNCHVTTVTKSGDGTRTTQRASYEIRQTTELSSVVAVTATNGIYRLNQPLEIGTRNGVRMRIVVGNWNWDRVAQSK